MFLLIIQDVFRDCALSAQLVVARADDVANTALANELGAETGSIMRDLVGMSMDRRKDPALVRLAGPASFHDNASRSNLRQHAA
jgi:hypothetical protein